jgi:hypothetical protein
MVNIQFSFTNEAAVPQSLIQYKRETAQESGARKSRATGYQAIAPTQNVCVEELLSDLSAEQYALVEAVYQRRLGGQGPSGQYYTVRFTFCRIEKAYVNPTMNALWDGAIAGFREICQTAYWRVRVFNNPQFDGKDNPVEGERSLSINCEVRTPRFEGGDRTKPVVMRRKDASGKKIGSPVPIQCDFALRIPEGGEITLIAAPPSVS